MESRKVALLADVARDDDDDAMASTSRFAPALRFT